LKGQWKSGGLAKQTWMSPWSRDSILQSIERSLQRLKTDMIDIVHLHSCSESELRKGEAIAALQMAREKGYTRYIG